MQIHAFPHFTNNPTLLDQQDSLLIMGTKVSYINLKSDQSSSMSFMTILFFMNILYCEPPGTNIAQLHIKLGL